MGFSEIKDDVNELHEEIKEGKTDSEIVASYVDKLTEAVKALTEELEGLEERIEVITEALGGEAAVSEGAAEAKKTGGLFARLRGRK
jgi:predicted  nucleic acid-binding Zn-ribbon protein